MQLSSLSNHQYTAYDYFGSVGNLTIYTAFDYRKHVNPVLDYYYAGRVKIMETSDAVKNMAVFKFDADGNYMEMPQSDNDIDTYLYYGDARATAITDNTNKPNKKYKFLVI